MLKDLKYALRMLIQGKGWTFVILLSLALGIGANTALFTAVNGVMLQTLAVPHPETLVRLKWAGDNDMVRSSSDYGSTTPINGRDVRSTFSYPGYLAMREANRTLTDLAATAPIAQANVIARGEAEIISLNGVSGSFYRLLQLTPALGRLLNDDDDRPDAAAAAVISDAYWRRRFAADPKVIGEVIMANGLPLTIVGVTGASYAGVQRLGTSAPDITVALAQDTPFAGPPPPGAAPVPRLSQPTYWWLQVFGRLKPGATLAQVRGNLEGPLQESARAGMAAYMSGLSDHERGLSSNRRDRSNVPEVWALDGRRGMYDLDNGSRLSAMVLAGVVAAVLLIVCANVANLLLSRATARQREIGIRLSMGATRGRLIRQLLTESVLLAIAGGAFGVAIGVWCRALLPFGQETPLDWRVFGFAFALSALTGIVFGLAPAMRATRVDLASSMKETSRSVIGTRSYLIRGLLILQVTLSLILLVGAGLFLRTLQKLHATDVGFNPDGLLMFVVNPQLSQPDPERASQLLADVQQAVQHVPGVRQVAVTRTAFLSGSTSSSSVNVQGGGSEDSMYRMTVSPAFFETMQIPVVLGRAFTDRDTKTAPKVVIINQTAARKLFAAESPVGRRIGFSPEQNGEYEIVGVVADTKYANVRVDSPPTMYQCVLQANPGRAWIVARTGGDPASLTNTVRAAVHQVDPNLPLTNFTTQREQVERRFAQERLFAQACSIFGGLALVLAAIGLFGLLSYSVSRRRNEIGIRMALGAQRGAVTRMILRESLLLVLLGIVFGVAGALAVGRYVASSLYGLSPGDMLSMASATALILAVAFVASYLPARRAARVDPLTALRE